MSLTKLRIAVCDYSGHPFQVQLSRELARRGHEVLHLHFAEFQTPKGRLQVEPGDAPTLAIEAVSLGQPFEKYSFIKRRSQEQEIGRRIADRIDAYAPDVVIGCNFPLDTLAQISARSFAQNRPYIYWLQDIFSTAIGSILAKKYGPLGRFIGAYYRRIEGRALRGSTAVVAIADDFKLSLARDFGHRSETVHVIENWAPLDEITPCPKDNSWSRANGLADRDVVLYTGTIGMKHDPKLILELATALRDRPRTSVVVTSEGPSAEWLDEEARKAGLVNFLRLPFQPFSVYAEVLGTADVLISVLEADAGSFSVPSKILSYLSSGRSVVLSAPPQNLASQIVTRADAGIAVPGTDRAAFIAAVRKLLDDSERRETCARHARAYAERAFDIVAIGDRFEAILADAVATKRRAAA